MISPYDMIERLRSISRRVSKVAGDIHGHEKAAQRHTSLQAMHPATAWRHAAPPPVGQVHGPGMDRLGLPWLARPSSGVGGALAEPVDEGTQGIGEVHFRYPYPMCLPVLLNGDRILIPAGDLAGRSALWGPSSHPALRMVQEVVDRENVVKRLRKPCCHSRATTCTGHTGGLVPCTQQRLQLDLPQGTHVMVRGEGQDAIVSAGDRIVGRTTGQATCHPCR